MTIAVIIVILVVAVLLTLVVLAQNSKGGGLASNFGGGSAQLMGVKKTGDFLEKFTWGLAIALLVLSLTANLMMDPTGAAEEGGGSINIERAKETSKTTAPLNAPSQEQPQQEEQQ